MKIVLDYPKYKENFAGIMRSAFIFGVEEVIVLRPRFVLKRYSQDTPNAFKNLKVTQIDNFDFQATESCAVVECDGHEISDEILTGVDTLIFGPEDGTCLISCEKRIKLPMVYRGKGACLNLCVAASIAMYELAKHESNLHRRSTMRV